MKYETITNYRFYLSNNLPKQSLSKDSAILVKLTSQIIALCEPDFLAHQK